MYIEQNVRVLYNLALKKGSPYYSKLKIYNP
jgi:hypothetical protein